MVMLPTLSRLMRALPLVLLVAGCAAPQAVTTNPPASFDRIGHEEVFAVGFRSISEKYIEPVAVSKIAMAGLAGFAAIDPALHVARVGDKVRLAVNGAIVHEVAVPADDDPRAWAAAAIEIEQHARAASALMDKADDEKIFEALFDGVLSELDVFSRYAGAAEARRNRARRDGFGGIGIRFKLMDSKPIVTEVMPDSPAAGAGLEVGDEITHIDGHALTKPRVGDIVERLRGPTHSEVQVRVYRVAADRSFDTTMNRKHIVPSTVSAEVRNGIAVLKISSFNQATARNMAKELREARHDAGGELRGLVLDLRGNPGGLLKQSVKVADLLLTHGHILSTRGRHPDSLHHYEAGGRDLSGGLPTAVLVDGKSASASEIVASALQDRGRAVVIGTASFGKGTVQTVIRLPNDGEVTLTWSRFVTPSGYTLHGLGVRPVVCTSGLTSGFDGAVRAIGHAGPKERSLFSSWRTTAFEAKDQRKTLRDSCASERRNGDGELQVARILLADQALYRQALDITATTSQAQK